MLFVLPCLRWKQSAGADCICSAAGNPRSPGFCLRCQVASLWLVLGFPHGSVKEEKEQEVADVATRYLYYPISLQRGNLHAANSNNSTRQQLPPRRSALCSFISLLCIVPFQRAKFQSHIFSRPWVSQCKLICVDKQRRKRRRRRSTAVGGLVRPRGSVCARHSAASPGTGGSGRVAGGCVVRCEIGQLTIVFVVD